MTPKQIAEIDGIVRGLRMVAEVLEYLKFYRLRDACTDAADYIEGKSRRG
jgi:hypothetical protein